MQDADAPADVSAAGANRGRPVLRADGREIVCPFGVPGDQLWVRERFAVAENGSVVYAADPVKGRSRLTWQQSRYLPREASRMTLRVLSTRPQRLQEISEADARAEGYDAAKETLSPIDWFARLWDRLSVTESLRWAANPWLWVVHFELIPQGKEIKPRRRTLRNTTIEEKQQIARMLRSK